MEYSTTYGTGCSLSSLFRIRRSVFAFWGSTRGDVWPARVVGGEGNAGPHGASSNDRWRRGDDRCRPPVVQWTVPDSTVVALSREVAEALARDEPVVALESSVIAQGLPRPVNFEAALQVEAAVREAGATPATVAAMDGHIRAGLTRDEIQRLAFTDGIEKAGLAIWGAPWPRARRWPRPWGLHL